jgi:hypothetical protein
VTRALILLLTVVAGVAHADTSTKSERRMLSEWQLTWPAKLPCSDFKSIDVSVDSPIDLVLHGKKRSLTLSHTGGVAVAAPHGPPGAGRRYPLPADFDVTTIDRVTASRADGVMLNLDCREERIGWVTWTLTFRKDAFGDVWLKSDTRLPTPVLCGNATLGDKSGAAAAQKEMEATLAEIARAACRGVPCREATRAMLAAPMQAGAPSEVVPDSTRGDGWRARFTRPEDSLQCWSRGTAVGDSGCVLTVGKMSLRETCWGRDPARFVVSAGFELSILARQTNDEPLWLTLSTDALEPARP